MFLDEGESVQLTFLRHLRTPRPWHDEQGIVLVVVLIVMVLLLGMGLTSLFSGYTNLLTSTNLKITTQARNTAEAGVNEALYRLSRQEGQPGAIVPDLSNPNWQEEIDFTSGDSNASDGTVSTIQPTADWPDEHPSHPVTIRFKKPVPAQPNKVLFCDYSQNPPAFITFTYPATTANPLPANAHPVIQITATGRDDREAERQIFAEVTASTAFAPPAPLSSGVDVDLNGSGFIDGVNHDHRIYITDANGTAGIYGDDSSETSDTPITSSSPIKDSPDDNVGATNTTFFNITVQAYPAGGNGGGSSSSSSSSSSGGGGGNSCESGVGNPNLNVPLSQVS